MKIFIVNIEGISSYRSTSSYENNKVQPTKHINELVLLLNKLFVSPYIYIIYSDDIRSLFNLNCLFDREVLENQQVMNYDNSDNAMSNSNKSILENLLD